MLLYYIIECYYTQILFLLDKNVINKSNNMSKIIENKEKETNSNKDIINPSVKIEITNEGKYKYRN